MTAENSSLRPGWAEPVGTDPRPHSRRRRAFGALAAMVTLFGGAAFVGDRSSASSSAPTTTLLDTSGIALAAFPVQPPCAFWDTFGAPRPGGRRHEGNDIGAAEGQALYAAVDGTITKIYHESPTNIGGNSVRLTAADGSNTYFFYAHLSSVVAGLAVGQKVAAGTVIGYVGHTGDANGVNHLHFEIHPKGGPAVDPYAALRAADACRAPLKGAPVVTLPPTTPAPATAATTATSPPTVSTVPGATPAPTVNPAPAPVPVPVPAKGPSQASGAGARLSIGSPMRVVNTAAGNGVLARAGVRTAYTVAGVNGVPAQVSLELLNVYAATPGSDGYLIVTPCDAGAVETATLNFRAGRNDATQALVTPVNRQVCVQSSVTTNIVIDVVGYDGGWTAGITAIRPTRLSNATTLVPGVPSVVKASGVGGMPPSNGVALTITTANAAGGGTIKAYPCDRSKPKVAQVTVSSGTSSTGINSRLAADGTVCLVSTVRVDVTVDATAAWALGGSTKLRAVSPVRAYDSRSSGGVKAGQVLTLQIANDELNWAATLASVVVTGLGSTQDGTIAVWPCGQPKPATTAVAVAARTTSSASQFVGLGDGKLCVSPSTDMQIIVDVNGGA